VEVIALCHAKVREFVQVLHVTTDRDGLIEETLCALPVVALEHY
jgi:hypothetical protein